MTGQELIQQQREAVGFIDDRKLRTEIAEVLPATVTEAAFVRAFKNAIIADPTGNLVKADRVSLYQAVLRCAMEGLLPDGRDAVILPFYDNKTKQHKAQFIPMIDGQRRICGEYGWALVAYVVYENDEFDPDLEAHRANHKPTKLGQPRGEIIGAYAIAEHRDGRRVGPVVMNMEDIQKVRSKSKQPGGQLWSEWFDRACMKTVAKRVMKQIPWDTKDRERIDRLVDAEEVNGEQAITMIYGSEVLPEAQAPLAPAAEGQGESDVPDSPAPPPFDGDEPTDETPVEDADIEFGEVVEEPTFTTGKHEGLTPAEVWALGEDGQRYVKWARRNWKTGAIVSALAAFAQEHPEIDQ